MHESITPVEVTPPLDGRRTLLAGDVFCTVTGRHTTPFPRARGVSERSNRLVRQWLIENLIAEAESRGDDHMRCLARALNPKNWSASDDACVGLYLFDFDDGYLWRRRVAEGVAPG